ncbi:hypothetical protein [Wenjunlia tyrosinilytica]|uniref:Uncharacterized protein n=1 Tax=Wenjunlia tyrosinilytica TaxID=1544741 RepID=A0A917ZZ03_9ACTN|nr:hypothetical protein [Wenjunlia tyrosinilytica]GGO98132.1 hypothetical protein GCM10012280_61550 [Wenjunlia tyrosinilytica]
MGIAERIAKAGGRAAARKIIDGLEKKLGEARANVNNWGELQKERALARDSKGVGQCARQLHKWGKEVKKLEAEIKLANKALDKLS